MSGKGSRGGRRGHVEEDAKFSEGALEVNTEEGGHVEAKERAVGEVENSSGGVAGEGEGGHEKGAEGLVEGASLGGGGLAAEGVKGGLAADQGGEEGSKGDRVGGGRRVAE